MDDATYSGEPRTCPVDGCEITIDVPHHILCDGHWQKLAAEQRREVERRYWTWRRTSRRWKWRTHGDYLLAVNNALKAAGRKPENPEEMPA